MGSVHHHRRMCADTKHRMTDTVYERCQTYGCMCHNVHLFVFCNSSAHGIPGGVEARCLRCLLRPPAPVGHAAPARVSSVLGWRAAVTQRAARGLPPRGLLRGTYHLHGMHNAGSRGHTVSRRGGIKATVPAWKKLVVASTFAPPNAPLNACTTAASLVAVAAPESLGDASHANASAVQAARSTLPAGPRGGACMVSSCTGQAAGGKCAAQWACMAAASGLGACCTL